MNWVHREPPVPARGLVVARSSAAQDLVERLIRDPERIAALTGLCDDDLLVVLGASDALP
ncbi:MAG: hypothetical protein ACI8PZ_001232 [Myxococcota bacterium]